MVYLEEDRMIAIVNSMTSIYRDKYITVKALGLGFAFV
jgi:hypothetical protein